MSSAATAVPPEASAPSPCLPPEELIRRRAERWKDCDGLEETTLLRLAMLRDLLGDMHAEKSRCLATGKRTEAQAFKRWEARISDLRTAAPLEGDLLELLRSDAKFRKRTRLLPEPLFSFIEREKLDRFDRVWESTIAAEAASLGWCFWVVDAWVEIQKAQAYHQALGDELIPHGVVLFAESAPHRASDPAPSDPEVAQLWHGYWFVVLKPQYRSPDFHLTRLLGASQQPSPATWKFLFSPKKR